VKLLFDFDESLFNGSLESLKHTLQLTIEGIKKIDKREIIFVHRYDEHGLSCVSEVFSSLDGESYNANDGYFFELYPTETFNYKTSRLNYINKRDYLYVLLRIIAQKLNSFGHGDQLEVLKLFQNILEKIDDNELKAEVINLLKCLFLGRRGFSGEKLPRKYEKVAPSRLPPETVMQYFIEPSNLQRLFDKKIPS